MSNKKCTCGCGPCRERIPIRVFACGHERPESIRAMFNVPFQRAGETGYCRVCNAGKKIVKVKA